MWRQWLPLAAAGGAVFVLLWERRRLVARGGRSCAVIVPGGGLTLEGKPTEWVRRRLKEAAELYRARVQKGQDCVIVTLSGGTPHKPMPTDEHSHFHIFEAEANARCLISDFGIPAEIIFEENWSLDTIGNAYMLRTVHADVAGWQELIIVTSEFHMPRTRVIFKKIFSLPPLPPFGSYKLSFVAVPNDGVGGEALVSRKQREAKSAANFAETTAAMQSLQEIHRFLFGSHTAYSSKRLLQEREPVNPKALETY